MAHSAAKHSSSDSGTCACEQRAAWERGLSVMPPPPCARQGRRVVSEQIAEADEPTGSARECCHQRERRAERREPPVQEFRRIERGDCGSGRVRKRAGSLIAFEEALQQSRRPADAVERAGQMPAPPGSRKVGEPGAAWRRDNSHRVAPPLVAQTGTGAFAQPRDCHRRVWSTLETLGSALKARRSISPSTKRAGAQCRR